MNKILCIGFLLMSNAALSQSLNRTFQYHGRSTMLLGQVTHDRLADDPFDEWYNQNFDDYEVQDMQLSDLLPDSITIFMGTWCGDSKREVPRFIKVLEQNNFDFDKLKIICLNTGFQNYKQAPEREERGMNIHRVPTFVFQNADGSEIGRIVEEPVVTLESDMRSVLKSEDYPTAYPVAQRVIEEFKIESVKNLKKKKNELLRDYSEIATNVYELNTYGYVLWSSFQLMEAEFVFELNQQLYPDSAVPLSAIAQLKSALGKQKEATRYLKTGLELEPDNRRLLEIQESWIREGIL